MTAHLAPAADPAMTGQTADPGELVIQACRRQRLWPAEPGRVHAQAAGSPKAHSAAAGLVNRKRRGNKLRSRRKQP